MWGSTPSYTTSAYTITSPQAPRKGFSLLEVEHILIAFVVLTFDFTVLYSGVAGPNMFFTQRTGTVNAALLGALPAALLVATTGFFSHEMAHKFVAQSMGMWAEFRMALGWLMLSIVGALIGFLFAAPGATVVRGVGTRREAGLLSLAGPGINMIWAAGFTAASLLPLHYWGSAYWSGAFFLVGFVNLWFAIFNLIPFGPLDGRKVLAWNHWVWGVAFFGTVAAFISFYIL
jgi:Zn-dependent protease